MLSLQLWRALQRPPTLSFLFRRAYSTVEEPFPWYVGCLHVLAAFLIFPIIAFAGTIYSLGWAVGIANLIGKERGRHTYELITLTPPGPLGASWLMALGYLYRHRTFRNVNRPGNLWLRVLLTAFVSAGLIFFEAFGLGTLDGLLVRFIVRFVMLIAALYLEHLQSAVLGLLSGLVATLAAKDGSNAQIFAFALYSGVQILSYLGTLLIGFSILPSLFRAAQVAPAAADILLTLIRVLLLVGLREIMIGLLWRRLIDLTGASAADTHLLKDLPR